mmetsp:Transcript_6631/g.11279  ORF Transcript_6631/g.11279 Transcript_6631/m.11279 type:complete len:132 (+) Transcript_6631:104-499(+)
MSEKPLPQVTDANLAAKMLSAEMLSRQQRAEQPDQEFGAVLAADCKKVGAGLGCCAHCVVGHMWDLSWERLVAGTMSLMTGVPRHCYHLPVHVAVCLVLCMQFGAAATGKPALTSGLGERGRGGCMPQQGI